MTDDQEPWRRRGEAFWRAHHDTWKRSDLNQREYCEAHGLPLKAFGNWRAKFKAKPEAQAPRLLYRRGGVSHTLSHRLSHTLGHGTYPTSPAPVVPPARAGHRRRFSEADRLRTLAETSRPGRSLSEIAAIWHCPKGALPLVPGAGCGGTSPRERRDF